MKLPNIIALSFMDTFPGQVGKSASVMTEIVKQGRKRLCNSISFSFLIPSHLNFSASKCKQFENGWRS